MSREIGSEFWDTYPIEFLSKEKNIKYLVSGRTALDFIIKDILIEKKICTAFLPSYCCYSIIEPFILNGINVKFYKVNSNGIEFDYNNGCEVVLLLDFFGFEICENEKIAKNQYLSGKVVIYDSTHKLNGNKKVEKWSHYTFCSYRKWFYCCYAMVRKKNGDFIYDYQEKVYDDYVLQRNQAVALKKQYIQGEYIDKCAFISLFKSAEDSLKNDYLGYSGIPVKFPFEEIIKKRKKNASYLIERLSACSSVILLRNKVLDYDVPLFVPILVEPYIRNELCKYLIDNDIFCPIHWPKTNLQNQYSDLYVRELSLICDQRYCLKDMERIVNEIEKFFGK